MSDDPRNETEGNSDAEESEQSSNNSEQSIQVPGQTTGGPEDEEGEN